jgi:Cd(II)/Pb(II)-responsive transcriptional regulator
MKIGELARATHTQADTIRYYEREGLLPEPARSEGNYRIYGPEHVERLRFVRHCRSLDMTLDEVGALLRAMDAPQTGCHEVAALIDQHLDHVTARIRELTQLKARLKALRTQCDDDRDMAHCGILNSLAVSASSLQGPAANDHVPGVHGHPRRKPAPLRPA